MQTRTHSHPLRLLQEQEWHALQYFSSWTLDTTLCPTVIDDLRSMRLLSSATLHCDCGDELTLHTATRGLDGYEYRCSRHGSRTHVTIRHHSWFANRKHSIPTYIVAVRMLAHGSHQHSVSQETHLDRHSLHRLYFDLCDGMVRALDDLVFSAEPFFCCDRIAEADETHMRWRGAVTTGGWEEVPEWEQGEWVFGMCNRPAEGDRELLRVWCTEGRRRADIIELVEEVTEPDTLICTDALITYNALTPLFRHHTINKAVDGFSRQGRDRVFGKFTITVNHVENMWGRLRRLGTERRLNKPADVPALCTEFMFRHYHLCWFQLLSM